MNKVYLPQPITMSHDVLELQLTPMEEKLLNLLIDKQGKVVTHTQIAYALWNEADGHLAPEMTRPLCARLRKKIGAERITTVHGRGYIYL